MLNWSHWLESLCVLGMSITEFKYLVPAQWHFVGFFLRLIWKRTYLTSLNACKSADAVEMPNRCWLYLRMGFHASED